LTKFLLGHKIEVLIKNRNFLKFKINGGDNSEIIFQGSGKFTPPFFLSGALKNNLRENKFSLSFRFFPI